MNKNKIINIIAVVTLFIALVLLYFFNFNSSLVSGVISLLFLFAWYENRKNKPYMYLIGLLFACSIMGFVTSFF
ncbi:hypothetical protein COE50_27510 [Bacillus anthracis]|nr:hypothetical protein COE50_27510 [Bacillus anthracis]